MLRDVCSRRKFAIHPRKRLLQHSYVRSVPSPPIAGPHCFELEPNFHFCRSKASACRLVSFGDGIFAGLNPDDERSAVPFAFSPWLA